MSVCSHFRGVLPLAIGGYPHPAEGGPHPRSRWEEVPHPRSRWGGGGSTTFQVQIKVSHSRFRQGVHHPRPGCWYPRVPLIHDWMMVQDGLDGVTPLSRTGWGNPSPLVGRHSSIANTCYAVGGIPLAFTQEDFLVILANFPLQLHENEKRNWTERQCLICFWENTVSFFVMFSALHFTITVCRTYLTGRTRIYAIVVTRGLFTANLKQNG